MRGLVVWSVWWSGLVCVLNGEVLFAGILFWNLESGIWNLESRFGGYGGAGLGPENMALQFNNLNYMSSIIMKTEFEALQGELLAICWNLESQFDGYGCFLLMERKAILLL